MIITWGDNIFKPVALWWKSLERGEDEIWNWKRSCIRGGFYTDWIALVLSLFLFCWTKLQAGSHCLGLIWLAAQRHHWPVLPSRKEQERAGTWRHYDPCNNQVMSSCHSQQMSTDRAGVYEDMSRDIHSSEHGALQFWFAEEYGFAIRAWCIHMEESGLSDLNFWILCLNRILTPTVHISKISSRHQRTKLDMTWKDFIFANCQNQLLWPNHRRLTQQD